MPSSFTGPVWTINNNGDLTDQEKIESFQNHGEDIFDLNLGVGNSDDFNNFLPTGKPEFEQFIQSGIGEFADTELDGFFDPNVGAAALSSVTDLVPADSTIDTWDSAAKLFAAAPMVIGQTMSYGELVRLALFTMGRVRDGWDGSGITDDAAISGDAFTSIKESYGAYTSFMGDYASALNDAILDHRSTAFDSPTIAKLAPHVPGSVAYLLSTIDDLSSTNPFVQQMNQNLTTLQTIGVDIGGTWDTKAQALQQHWGLLTASEQEATLQTMLDWMPDAVNLDTAPEGSIGREAFLTVLRSALQLAANDSGGDSIADLLGVSDLDSYDITPGFDPNDPDTAANTPLFKIWDQFVKGVSATFGHIEASNVETGINNFMSIIAPSLTLATFSPAALAGIGASFSVSLGASYSLGKVAFGKQYSGLLTEGLEVLYGSDFPVEMERAAASEFARPAIDSSASDIFLNDGSSTYRIVADGEVHFLKQIAVPAPVIGDGTLFTVTTVHNDGSLTTGQLKSFKTIIYGQGDFRPQFVSATSIYDGTTLSADDAQNIPQSIVLSDGETILEPGGWLKFKEPLENSELPDHFEGAADITRMRLSDQTLVSSDEAEGGHKAFMKDGTVVRFRDVDGTDDFANGAVADKVTFATGTVILTDPVDIPSEPFGFLPNGVRFRWDDSEGGFNFIFDEDAYGEIPRAFADLPIEEFGGTVEIAPAAVQALINRAEPDEPVPAWDNRTGLATLINSDDVAPGGLIFHDSGIVEFNNLTDGFLWATQQTSDLGKVFLDNKTGILVTERGDIFNLSTQSYTVDFAGGSVVIEPKRIYLDGPSTGTVINADDTGGASITTPDFEEELEHTNRLIALDDFDQSGFDDFDLFENLGRNQALDIRNKEGTVVASQELGYNWSHDAEAGTYNGEPPEGVFQETGQFGLSPHETHPDDIVGPDDLTFAGAASGDGAGTGGHSSDKLDIEVDHAPTLERLGEAFAHTLNNDPNAATALQTVDDTDGDGSNNADDGTAYRLNFLLRPGAQLGDLIDQDDDEPALKLLDAPAAGFDPDDPNQFVGAEANFEVASVFQKLNLGSDGTSSTTMDEDVAAQLQTDLKAAIEAVAPGTFSGDEAPTNLVFRQGATTDGPEGSTALTIDVVNAQNGIERDMSDLGDPLPTTPTDKHLRPDWNNSGAGSGDPADPDEFQAFRVEISNPSADPVTARFPNVGENVVVPGNDSIIVTIDSPEKAAWIWGPVSVTPLGGTGRFVLSGESGADRPDATTLDQVGFLGADADGTLLQVLPENTVEGRKGDALLLEEDVDAGTARTGFLDNTFFADMQDGLSAGYEALNAWLNDADRTEGDTPTLGGSGWEDAIRRAAGEALDAAASTTITNDLDGDGDSDAIFQDPNSGDVFAVFFADSIAEESVQLGTVDVATTALQATSDLNGDGQAELIFNEEAKIWTLDGDRQGTEINLGKPDGSDWSIASAGSFSGDRKGDLLWYNTASGGLKVWDLAPGFDVRTKHDLGTINAGSIEPRTADIDFDGDADIFYQDAMTGEVHVLVMEDFAQVQDIVLGTAPSDSELVKAASIDGDPRPDLLFQKTTGARDLITQDLDVSLSSAGLSASFGAASQSDGDGTAVSATSIGDFTGDGRADVVSGSNLGSGAPDIQIRESDGEGLTTSKNKAAPVLKSVELFEVSAHLQNGTVLGTLEVLNGAASEVDWSFVKGNEDFDGDGISPYGFDDQGRLVVVDGDDIVRTTANRGMQVQASTGVVTSDPVQVSIDVDEVGANSYVNRDGKTYDPDNIGLVATENEQWINTLPGFDPQSMGTIPSNVFIEDETILTGNPDIDGDGKEGFWITSNKIQPEDVDDLNPRILGDTVTLEVSDNRMNPVFIKIPIAGIIGGFESGYVVNFTPNTGNGGGDYEDIVRLRDINQDGALDIIGRSPGVYDDDLQMFQNEFGAGPEFSFTEIDQVDEIFDFESGDFDGDGDTDIVWTVWTGWQGGSLDYDLRLLENTGSATSPSYAPDVTLDDNAAENDEIRVGDLDGDGDPDIVRVDETGQVKAWYNDDGNGGFETHNVAAGTHIGASSHDFDGDGVDEFVSSMDSNKITFWKSDGQAAPSFTESAVAVDDQAGLGNLLPELNIENEVIADVDGDSDPDIVAVLQPDDPTTGETPRLVWFDNDASGGTHFTAREIDHVAEGTGRMATVSGIHVNDFDGDGHRDIGIVIQKPDAGPDWLPELRAYLSDGATVPAFTSRTVMRDAQIEYLRVGDLNGDNRADIVMNNSGGSPKIMYSDGQFDSLPTDPFILTAKELEFSDGGHHLVDLWARDPDGEIVDYAITGGEDAQFYKIDATDGRVTHTVPPFVLNNNADSNADGLYKFEVTVTDDDGNTDSREFEVEYGFVFGDHHYQIPKNIKTNENGKLVWTLDFTSHRDLPTLPDFNLTGVDSTFFELKNGNEIWFKDVPDFEDPLDANLDNVYELTVSDGNLFWNVQSTKIHVQDVRDPSVSIDDPGAVTVDEGASEVVDLDATVIGPGTASFSIDSGVDAGAFSIDAATGVLTLDTAADFEAPVDSDGDNTYDVTVGVTDGQGHSDTRTLSVAVNDKVEPELSGPDAPALTENTTTVAKLDVQGGDPQDTLSVSLSGADAGEFSFDQATGELAFTSAPDFENPTDSGADNTYDVTVEATSGGNTVSHALTVEVTDATPFTGLKAEPMTVDGSADVTTLPHFLAETAASPNAALTGADAADLQLDPTTGALSFTSAPTFVDLADSDGDSVYDITLSATDIDGNTVTKDVGVRVIDSVLASFGGAMFKDDSLELEVGEGESITFQPDVELKMPGEYAFQVIPNRDSSHFSVNEVTDTITFTAPSYETPEDGDGDNVYSVTTSLFSKIADSMPVDITVADVNGTPSIDAPSTMIIGDGETLVGTIPTSNTDSDEGVTLGVQGLDGNAATVDKATNELRLRTPTDFNNPKDFDGDGIYDLTIVALDANGDRVTQDLSVEIVSGSTGSISLVDPGSVSVAEDGATLAVDLDVDVSGSGTANFAISGGVDAAAFGVDAATGELSFTSAPDFENPTDDGGDNTYNVQVTADDGQGNSDSLSLAIAVTDVDATPVLSAPSGVNVDEHTQGVTSVSASLADGGEGPVSYGLSGTDAGAFSIDSSGNLDFASAPDFENPTDDGGDNVYDVTVTATDADGDSDSQAMAVSVNDISEGPIMLVDPGSVGVAEDGGTLAVDLDAVVSGSGTANFAISGGVDAAAFDIDAATGELSFTSTPDYEAPTDDGGDNTYNVQVTADDGQGNSDSLNLAIAVTDVDATPVLSAPSAISVDENTTAVMSVSASLADAGEGPVTYGLSGTDAGAFAIDGSGSLSFASAPDHENPTDNGGDNVYDVTVTATDQEGDTDSQAIAVSVTDTSQSNGNAAPLVAYDFSSGTGTTVVDRSGNGRDSTIQGDPQWKAGESGLVFDGNGDKTVDADADTYLEGSDAVTVAISVKAVATGVDAGILATESSTDGESDELFMRYDASGWRSGESSLIQAGVHSTEGASVIETASNLQSTDVQHIALSWQSGEAPTLYVDGSAVTPAHTDGVLNGTLSNVDDLILGRGVKSDGFWDGAIRDFKVFDRALAGSEIADLASGGSGASGGGITLTDPGSVSLAEDGATLAVDLDANVSGSGTANFAISGGVDAAAFGIDAATGELSFTSAPDFENPTDDGGDNTYNVQVTADDGQGNSDSLSLAIDVTDVDATPSVSAPSMVYMTEGQLAVTQLETTLADAGEGPVSYAVSGTDAGAFTIDGSGKLSFTSAPDTDLPSDADSDNVYDVTVTATDADGDTDSQAVSVDVAPSLARLTQTGDIMTNALLHYDFSSGTGTTAVDRTGNGYDGTILGGAAWAPSAGADGALSFDGSDDAVEQSGLATALSGLSGATATLRVKADAIGADTGLFATESIPDGSDDNFGLRYDSDGSGGAVNAIKASAATGSGAVQAETISDQQTTAWQDLAVTWQDGGGLGIHVNGRPTSLSYADGSASGTLSDIETFLLGRAPNGGVGWDGLIDDVRVFDTTLSDHEIWRTATDLRLGTTGDDTMVGSEGPDIVAAGPGNDTLTGNGGGDAFVFPGEGAGHDTITDFEYGDVLQLGSFNSLAGSIEMVNGDTVVTHGVDDATITLVGVDASNLTMSGNIVGFAT